MFLFFSFDYTLNYLRSSNLLLNPELPRSLASCIITYRTDDPPPADRSVRRGKAVLVHCRILHHQVVFDTIMNSTSIEISNGQDIIHMSAVYKPRKSRHVADLNKLTNGCDLDSEHPYWNSHYTNTLLTKLFIVTYYSLTIQSLPQIPQHTFHQYYDTGLMFWTSHKTPTLIN